MAQGSASSRRDVREAEKRAAIADAERQRVILNIMSTMAGRAYIHEQLSRSSVFSTTFSESALTMAFREGNRNAGLQTLNDIISACPDQYVLMMQEASHKEQAQDNGRSSATERSREQDTDGGDQTADEPDLASALNGSSALAGQGTSDPIYGTGIPRE